MSSLHKKPHALSRKCIVEQTFNPRIRNCSLMFDITLYRRKSEYPAPADEYPAHAPTEFRVHTAVALAVGKLVVAEYTEVTAAVVHVPFPRWQLHQRIHVGARHNTCLATPLRHMPMRRYVKCLSAHRLAPPGTEPNKLTSRPFTRSFSSCDTSMRSIRLFRPTRRSSSRCCIFP